METHVHSCSHDSLNSKAPAVETISKVMLMQGDTNEKWRADQPLGRLVVVVFRGDWDDGHWQHDTQSIQLRRRLPTRITQLTHQDWTRELHTHCSYSGIGVLWYFRSQPCPTVSTKANNITTHIRRREHNPATPSSPGSTMEGSMGPVGVASPSKRGTRNTRSIKIDCTVISNKKKVGRMIERLIDTIGLTIVRPVINTIKNHVFLIWHSKKYK